MYKIVVFSSFNNIITHPIERTDRQQNDPPIVS
jgi:hypothetical protein